MPVFESPVLGRSAASPGLFFRDGAVEGGGKHPLIKDDAATSDAETSPRVLSSPRLMRGFDIAVSAVAIVLLLPFMIAIYALVRLTSAGPGVFSQKRVGREGELFPCLKFRSMVVDAQQQLDKLLSESPEARLEWDRDQKLRNDPRVTVIGNFLRKTSLDELPQLFNVLAGQMSIVGPRPIVQNEIVRYGDRFAAYCSVRPGLTGLWQMSGRNDVSYAMRVRLDTLYVRRQSLPLDVAICLRTVPALLNSRGCY